MHTGAIKDSFPHDIGILRSNTVVKRMKEEIKSKELVGCGGGYFGDVVGGTERASGHEVMKPNMVSHQQASKELERVLVSQEV